MNIIYKNMNKKALYYFQIIMSSLYILAGMYFLLIDKSLVINAMFKPIFGGLLIAYGGFRLYRILKSHSNETN